MRQIILTTNDAELSDGDKIRIRDLGIGFTHPTTDFNLSEEESIERLRGSTSLQDLIDSNKVIIKDDQGKSVTDIKTYLTPQFFGEKVFDNDGRVSELEVSQSDEPYTVSQVSFTTGADSVKYEVKWYAEVSASKNNKEVLFYVKFDDTTDIACGRLPCKGKDKFYPLSGFTYETIASGSHTISFEIRSPEKGVSVKIRRLVISVEKKD
jgi:hypothetical protein